MVISVAHLLFTVISPAITPDSTLSPLAMVIPPFLSQQLHAPGADNLEWTVFPLEKIWWELGALGVTDYPPHGW